MLIRHTTFAFAAALLSVPAWATTAPSTPKSSDHPVLPALPVAEGVPDQDDEGDDDFGEDDDGLDEAIAADDDMQDSALAAEQEVDEQTSVEPKDDGEDLNQVAEDYLATTSQQTASDVAVAAERALRREPVSPLERTLGVKPVALEGAALIAKIQAELNAKGAKLALDGQMGKQTRAALLKFQKRNGLPADGNLGPNTLAKLKVKQPTL